MKKLVALFVIFSLLNACTFGNVNKNLDFRVKSLENRNLNENAIIIFKPLLLQNYNSGAFSKNYKKGVEHRFGQIIFQEEQTGKKVFGSERDPVNLRAANILLFPVFFVALFLGGIVPFLVFGKSYKPISTTDYIALEVPAGTYNIVTIYTMQNVELENLQKHFNPMEFKAGNVYYLGDIEFSFYSKGFSTVKFACIKTINRIHEAQELMPEYKLNESFFINKDIIC